jgi:lipocalin
MLLLVFASLFAGASALPSFVAELPLSAPPSVSSLSIAHYLGRWYQVYGSASVQDTFEAGGSCVTADYGPTSRADVVTVRNTVRVLGFPVSVSGYAVANPEHAGELDVTLGPSADPAKAGNYSTENYRVFELGPVQVSIRCIQFRETPLWLSSLLSWMGGLLNAGREVRLRARVGSSDAHAVRF